jgi:hypothetical protein
VYKRQDYITIPGTKDGKLNFPQDGNYTICAWALLDTSDGTSHCIVSKGYEQYYLRSTYINTTGRSEVPLWEFVEFADVNGQGNWRPSTFPAECRQWSLLVGVRKGTRQLLYCNGVLVDSTTDIWKNAVSRSTFNDLSIGRFSSPVSIPTPDGFCHFKGSIDEVRILNAPQSADWVRLCYMNQRPDNRLVVFR